ncbi:MAG: 4-(cytidine 5'-diphospho)-2-C-methyl-D-erythritol kinase [Thioalkalivibrionaceae bacterium]
MMVSDETIGAQLDEAFLVLESPVLLDGWMWWPAPAKVNRFLRIVGRREDGFHLIETFFQFVDWCDWIGVRKRDDAEFSLRGGVAGEDDLCLRAARFARHRAGVDVICGADLRLIKRLPTGAGLGGGSSDAATVLAALHALWAVQEPLDSWAGASVELGADVPVFVAGRAAFGSGIGDVLDFFEADEARLTIIAPNEHCSTVEMYRDPALERNAPKLGFDSTWIETLAKRGGRAPFENAFEPLARRYPSVDKVLRRADQARLRAHLNGSGSSCVVYSPTVPYPMSTGFDHAGATVDSRGVLALHGNARRASEAPSGVDHERLLELIESSRAEGARVWSGSLCNRSMLFRARLRHLEAFGP